MIRRFAVAAAMALGAWLLGIVALAAGAVLADKREDLARLERHRGLM